MPTGKSHIVYWDTCIFIAWMTNEKRQPGHMEGLKKIADLVERGDLVLLTSTLTRAEILQSKTPPEAMRKYDSLLRRTNVVAQNVDLPIAKLTSELMDFYIGSDFELLTPDAIHLATAIHFNADEFHTFDGVDPKSPRKSRYKRSGLLLLDGNIAGHKLKVHIPSVDQFELSLAAALEPSDGPFLVLTSADPIQEDLTLEAGSVSVEPHAEPPATLEDDGEKN